MYWGVKPAHKGKKIGRSSQKIAYKYFIFGLDLFDGFVHEIII